MQPVNKPNPARRRSQRLDAVQLRLYSQLLDAVCEEMGSVLQRSAYSPNIKERRDFSTALFDTQGRLAAQGHNIPVHLGSMFSSVQAVLEQAQKRGRPLDRGDVILLNDPYRGGTHLPDLTMVAPFFAAGGTKPVFFLANRAHHADIGGSTGGGLGLATELLQEGLVIPPVHLLRAGRYQEDILDLILANNRTPEERRGDLEAQLASLRRGELRLTELLERQTDAEGPKLSQHLPAVLEGLYAYSGQAVQELTASLPKLRVEYSVELELPDSSKARPTILHLRLQRRRDRLQFDFRASSAQHEGPFNAVRAITLSAVFYCLRCLLPEEVPTNQGLLSGIELLTTPGSIVDALPPAAVAAANVETSQRLVDLVFGALAILLPDRIPASSQGTMNNVVFSGNDMRAGRAGSPFTYYETLAGGHGGSPYSAGLAARHSHMTNTLNTPVEALEHAYPLRVARYALRHGSGGQGRHRGGDGLVREYELLTGASAVILSQNRLTGPSGAAGGKDGVPGENTLRSAGRTERLPACAVFQAFKGSRFEVQTPGGGGWGKPGADSVPKASRSRESGPGSR